MDAGEKKLISKSATPTPLAVAVENLIRRRPLEFHYNDDNNTRGYETPATFGRFSRVDRSFESIIILCIVKFFFCSKVFIHSMNDEKNKNNMFNRVYKINCVITDWSPGRI